MAKEKLEIGTKKFLTAPNAQLRGEARNTDATAWHFNTKTNAYQKCHAC